jgi:uncharacterized membrane protein YfcA
VLLFAGLSGLYTLLREKTWRGVPDGAQLRGVAGGVGDGRGAPELTVRLPVLLALGASVGFVSGVAGIGGGIVLAPILLRFPGAKAQNVAALSSGFIFLNSVAGLAGQIAKSGMPAAVESALVASLVLAVFAGGSIGTTLALRTSSQRIIRGGSHVLVSLVGGRLLILV